MAGNQGNNRIVWDQWQLDFLFNNWEIMNSRELSEALGITRTKVREKLYEHKLYKMTLEYWTEEQIQFLKDNFKEYGDSELAEIYDTKWNKNKGWNKKHIEKKRRYLNLKRTTVEKKLIHERNALAGRFKSCPVHAWDKRGRSEFGERRIWLNQDKRPVMVIKLKNGFVHYATWLWEWIYGPIPPGHIVRLKDGDPFNVVPGNLIMVSRSEHAIMNSRNRVPKEVKEIINLNNQLKKIIYEQNRKADSAAP